ncbi:MAG: hypothetical protein LBJ69_02045 [Holosporales bacterium]|nr:hypothetical protein [Holosporales bacterium]
MKRMRVLSLIITIAAITRSGGATTEVARERPEDRAVGSNTTLSPDPTTNKTRSGGGAQSPDDILLAQAVQDHQFKSLVGVLALIKQFTVAARSYSAADHADPESESHAKEMMRNAVTSAAAELLGTPHTSEPQLDQPTGQPPE